MDRQGRITIPAHLRKYASLERELVIVGLEDRLEIWDLASLEAYQEKFLEQFAQGLEGVR